MPITAKRGENQQNQVDGCSKVFYAKAFDLVERIKSTFKKKFGLKLLKPFERSFFWKRNKTLLELKCFKCK